MKEQKKLDWQNQILFITIAIIIFILVTNLQAIAQKFKSGDNIEGAPSGIND